MASMTEPESMMAPSTIASGGSGSRPTLTSWYSEPPLPPALGSTAVMADDPPSTPTSPFVFPNSATGASPLPPGLLRRGHGGAQARLPADPRRKARIHTHLRKIVKV